MTLTIRLSLVIGLLAAIFTLGILASIPLAKMEKPEDLPGVDNSQAIAIDNANVITMVGNQVLRNRQVLIENGVIRDIVAAGTPVEAKYQLIDANKGWLLPGLFDMHVHVYDRKYQVLSLTYGVTTVRNMAGFPFHLRWAKELKAGEWLGSSLLSASPILNDPEHADPLGHVSVANPARARELVAQYKNEGWDFIKIYENLSADVYQAIINEAETQNIPVVGHVPYSIVENDYPLSGAMQSLEHVEEIYEGPLDFSFDKPLLERVAQQLSSQGATVTPTLMIFDQLAQISKAKQQYLDDLPMEYINPLVKFIIEQTDARRWLAADSAVQDHNIRQNQFHQDIVRSLYRNRVNMVLGSDSGALYAIQGLSTHDEMDLMVKSGLSPWSVLRTATTNAAGNAGLEDSLGTIEAGKLADLLLVWENPLFDLSVLREPRAVIKNGQFLDRERILELRVSALNQSHPYTTLGRLLEFQFYR